MDVGHLSFYFLDALELESEGVLHERSDDDELVLAHFLRAQHMEDQIEEVRLFCELGKAGS